MLAKVNAAARISAISKKGVETRSELCEMILESAEQADSYGNNSRLIIVSVDYHVEDSGVAESAVGVIVVLSVNFGTNAWSRLK